MWCEMEISIQNARESILRIRVILRQLQSKKRRDKCRQHSICWMVAELSAQLYGCLTTQPNADDVGLSHV